MVCVDADPVLDIDGEDAVGGYGEVYYWAMNWKFAAGLWNQMMGIRSVSYYCNLGLNYYCSRAT